MAGPVLYSTNSWLAHNIATQYRGGNHFVWCSDYYDPTQAPAGAAGQAIAPSSSPKEIYDRLLKDYKGEDVHSALINGYRKTFKNLAKAWLADGSISAADKDEIISVAMSKSWRIWRPVLFVIPKSPFDGTDRVKQVVHPKRAGFGPEMQIVDLKSHEFDVIEL